LKASMTESPALEFEGVSFCYRRSDRPALSLIDLTIPAGSFIGLIGANGAGKSTLCFTANRIVPEFYRGQLSGAVRVLGSDISGIRIPDMTASVGMVFQDFEAQIFSTSLIREVVFVMENLGMPRDLMLERAAYWIREMGLTGLEDRDPSELSGGQKQRLVLASVLASNPPLLVLDEPTTDLDPVSSRGLSKCLRDLAREGCTVVLATHDMGLLTDADRIIALSKGEIIESGAPEEILTKGESLRRLGVQQPQLANVFDAIGHGQLITSPVEAARRLAAMGYRASRIQPSGSSDSGRREILSIEHMHFQYTPNRPLLHDLSLSIGEGEFVALLGQNGSGKTTLINLIAGVMKPQTGTISIEGRSLMKLTPGERARLVGVVFQNPDHQIFCKTSLEEVLFGLQFVTDGGRDAQSRAMSALELVGLADKAEVDPFTMTKGERKKLAVASVLACEPRILLLDEPTTGLDAVEQEAMMEMVSSLVEQGHTVVFITHSVNLAAVYAGRVIAMAEGEIVLDARVPEAFFDEPALGRAGLVAPAAVSLGRLLGVEVRTPLELAGLLTREG
jgi:energy-coupling factor transporter ATP-binding protein EcfA2